MSEHKRLYLLISIMTGVALLVGGITIFLLYRAAIQEERERLMETAQSQARLIEAIARFDRVQSSDYRGGSAAATISQIVDAHQYFKGVGETGEFTLARREGDQIIFLLNHRHHDLEDLQPVPWDSELAQPMRLALSGFSGTVIAVDYRGATVLAAHEPVAELNLGIVAKIDLAEVRSPFINAGLVAFAAGALVIMGASLLFLRISNPMISQIQEQNARLRAILSNAAEGIVTFNQQGIIESLNPAAEQMFGRSEHDARGQEINSLVTATHRERIDELVAQQKQADLQATGSHHELIGIHHDGSEFPIELAISEVRAGELRFFIGIVRDITDRQLAEQNARLAVMGQMVSTVAHESRNSLQRVQTGVDMLRLDLGDNPEALEELDRIERAGGNLTRLSDELREYAAPIVLDLGKDDLRETWQHAWDSLSHLRENRRVELREQVNGIDLHCAIDAFRMEQVFRNLMENSLAACDDPVRIDISCHESLHNGARSLCVSFRDNGPGLTDAQIKRVFEAFFTTKSRGTGLGMAIAQRILQAHHGAVTVGNQDQGGAEFVINLPRNGEEEDER